MNKEVSKIRAARKLEKQMTKKPVKVSDEHMVQLVSKIHANLLDLYYVRNPKDVDINLFVNRIVENIYLILDTFNEMNIYPDYFYDRIADLCFDFQNKMKAIEGIKNNYRERKEIELVADIEFEKAMFNGLEKKYYHIQAYKNKDIGEAYNALVKQFDKYDIPHGETTKENCLYAFDSFYYQHNNTVTSLLNTDYDHEDIEFLSILLFEYLSFFVMVGINPKEYLDKYISEHADEEILTNRK